MKFPWLRATATNIAVGVACYAAMQGNGLAFAGWFGIAFVTTACIIHHHLGDREQP
jgi:hypothetical protein